MIIAIVVSFTLSGRGGMETTTSIAVRELEKSGDTIHIIMPDGETDKAWTNGFNCHYVSTGGGRFGLLAFICKLTMLLTHLKPDLILGIDQHAVAYSRFYRYLRHNTVRIGSWMHFALVTHGNNPRKLLKHADFHLAISSGIADDLNRLFKKTGEPVYLIFNPIHVSERTIIRSAIPTFIYLGRLAIEQKRLDDFLLALAELNGTWKAMIIGDGSDANQIKQLARDLHLEERIEWPGWVNDPWNWITEASAMVLTSEFEGFPNVLVEALNRGLPCISSDCPTGPADIIINGINGWLYPLHDLERLQEILQKIVDDPVLNLPEQQTVKQTGTRFAAEKVVAELRRVLVAEVYKIIH